MEMGVEVWSEVVECLRSLKMEWCKFYNERGGRTGLVEKKEVG